MCTLRTPGWVATRVSTSFLIWARSGQPPMVSFTPTVTSPSRRHRGAGGHAEVDDVAAQLGVDHAAEQLQDVLGGGRGVATGGTARDFTGPARVNSTPWTDGRCPRLDVLKALGDNTRYAIYLELARSPPPLATADVAETLGLHPNTVRPHLERMRDVGLLDVAHRGPHRRRPPAAPLLAWPPRRRRSASSRPRSRCWPACSSAWPRRPARPATTPPRSGRDQGQARRRPATPSAASCLEALVAELDDARLRPGGRRHATTARPPSSAFAHCPFRELAEAHPELVCSLHRGMVEGFVDGVGGGEVDDFHPLVHRHALSGHHLHPVAFV